MSAALARLLRLINEGVEYPDAHCRVVDEFKVDGDALQDAYDEACAAYAARHP